MRRRWGTVLLAAFGGLAQAIPQLQPYCSVRFGFCVSAPSDLRPLAPPDNGDGQTWQSADGQVELRAWGSYSPEVMGRTTPSAYAKWLRAAEIKDGSRLTYQFVGANQIVFSGSTRAGQVFYSKTLLRQGTAIAVRVQYPKSLKPVWDNQTVRIAASLRFRP